MRRASRSWPDVRVVHTSLGLVVAFMVAGCGSVGDGTPESASFEEETSSSVPGDSDSASAGSSPTGTDSTSDPGSTSDSGSTTVTGSPDLSDATDAPSGIPTLPSIPTDGASTTGATEDPSGPDFVLYSLPECSVVPGGSVSGADNLTIFVALRNSGPGTWSTLVPFALSSDTGLAGQGNSAISTGSSFAPMQVDLRPTDYNRSHHFTVTADPANTIVERSESNNMIEIDVQLPARPSNAGNVPCFLA